MVSAKIALSFATRNRVLSHWGKRSLSVLVLTQICLVCLVLVTILTSYYVWFREPLITNIMWRNLLVQVYISCLYSSCYYTFCFLRKFPLQRVFSHFTWSLLIVVWEIQAAYQVSVLLVLNFRGKSLLGLKGDSPVHANKIKNTLIFNAFVLCQVSL